MTVVVKEDTQVDLNLNGLHDSLSLNLLTAAAEFLGTFVFLYISYSTVQSFSSLKEDLTLVKFNQLQLHLDLDYQLLSQWWLPSPAAISIQQ